MHETLSQRCSANKVKSKQSIVNETLSQNYSAEINELCSTEEDKEECTKTDQKYTDTEVTYDVPYNFNVLTIFECIRNNPDVSYEWVYRATKIDEYFTEMLDHLNKYNDRQSQTFSSKNLKESVLRVMEEEEEEIEHNINSIK